MEDAESASQEGAGHKALARSQQERMRRELGRAGLGWAGRTREKEMETLLLAGPPGGSKSLALPRMQCTILERERLD